MSEPTEWGTRINAAAQALGFSSEELTKLLQQLGISEEAEGVSMLDDEEIFKFGDFREAIPAPIAKLRLAFKCLRGGKKAEDRGTADERTAALQALGHKRKLEDAETVELLKLYDPWKTKSDPVTRILMERYGDRPMVAFRDGDKVAVEETAAYIADLEQGTIEAAETLMVDGSLTKLWPFGEREEIMLDEDPIYPGVALTKAGRSQRTFHDWSKIDLPTRQLCRVIVDRGEINPENREAVLRLLERAEAKTLATVYPEADLTLREMFKKGDAPRLKIASSEQRKPNNPFGIKRKY